MGKNHLAQAIHNDGVRATKPFLSINCRAIPHELMVGELLGEEDSFHVRPSKFELADAGTLFLDQVDSLSLEMQAAVQEAAETATIIVKAAAVADFRPVRREEAKIKKGGMGDWSLEMEGERTIHRHPEEVSDCGTLHWLCWQVGFR